MSDKRDLLEICYPDGSHLRVRSSKLAKRDFAYPEHINATVARYFCASAAEFEFSKHYECTCYGEELAGQKSVPAGGVCFEKASGAIFFEQVYYQIIIRLPEAVEARIFSPLESWCEAADWDSENHRLTVPLNFGNELGDFELCWEWQSEEGRWYSSSFKACVYSLKLDIVEDFRLMLGDIASRFPKAIQPDYFRQTTWGWQSSSAANSLDASWLMVFREVRARMQQGFYQLEQRHRRRLVAQQILLRPEQMRKLTPALEQKIAQQRRIHPDKKFACERKTLSSDTPENRYIKHILVTTTSVLGEISARLSGNKRVAEVFCQRLEEWQNEWMAIRGHDFWRNLSEFKGEVPNSQVLSQDPVYASIRHCWVLLNRGVELLDHDLRGGMPDAAKIYELWCLVKLDAMIISLGWYPCAKEPSFPVLREDDDRENGEDRSGAFKLCYAHAAFGNVLLELLFQPTAGSKANNNIWPGMFSTPAVQRPDLVLRLHRNDLPHSPTYSWIFDAKYRVSGNQAPEDAINQMHRYRDAILWMEQSAATGQKAAHGIRESIGGYILYPGDDAALEADSDQIESIRHSNIGALPLSPKNYRAGTGQTNRFLLQHLESILQLPVEKVGDSPQTGSNEKALFAAVPPVKAPFSGNCAIVTMRTYMACEDYWKTCRLYRLPLKEAQESQMDWQNWDYLCPQKPAANNRQELVNYGLFPVLSRQIMKRDEIVRQYQDAGVTIEAAMNGRDAQTEYVLFELGEPVRLAFHTPWLDPGNIAMVPEL